MSLDDQLRRYRRNGFTDEDVMRCTGLSERKWRELIKDKAVRTFTHRPGRGRIRLCDATTLKRAAVIAALNRAGLSLAVSARLAYFVPFHTALYELCDPSMVLLGRSAPISHERDLPPRLQTPATNWFDAGRPARADPTTDWLVKIFDGRFVGIKFGPKETVNLFGDLRDGGTRFVAWLPLHRKSEFVGCGIEKLARQFRRDRLADAVAAWEDPTRWLRELAASDYSCENHASNDDPLRTAAEASVYDPVFSVTINISFALRKALRRYLGIEPTEAISVVEELP